MTIERTLEKLLDALVNLVNEDDAPWQEKKDAVLAALKEDRVTAAAFEEFISWFEGETIP